MHDPTSATVHWLDSPTQPAGWHWDPILGQARFGDPVNQTVKSFPAPARPATAARTDPTPKPEPAQPGPCPQRSKAEKDLDIVCSQFGRLVAEALDGKRRIGALTRWFTFECLEALTRQRQRVAGHNVRLASIRVQAVSPRCAEVTLRLTTDSHSHPAALRVVRLQDHWICTDLEIA